MKLLSIAFAVASANIANLDWSTMTRAEKVKWCKDKYWTVTKEVNGEMVKVIEKPTECVGFERGDALEGQLMLFSNARNYGCWCDLEDALRRNSRGQPVNALDQACMDLHHGYNCITIDMPNCNPRILNATDDYVLPLTSISPILDPKQECQQYNQGNTCGLRTCQVEAQFLRETYTPVYSGDQSWLDMWNDFDVVHQADGGNFDFEGVCNSAGRANGPPNPVTPQPGLPQGDKQCCGQYPFRNSYYTGRAKCCNNVISPLGTC